MTPCRRLRAPSSRAQGLLRTRTLCGPMLAAAVGILFLPLFLPDKAHALRPLTLRDEAQPVTLGRYLEYLPDPGGDLEISEVAAPSMFPRFVPGSDEILNFGFSRTAYWVRFELLNPDDRERSVLLEVGSPLIDEVDLYGPGPEGAYSRETSGLAVPVKQRSLKYRRPVFSLTLPAGASVTYFMRFRDYGSVPIAVRVWDPAAFSYRADFETHALSIYYGAMGIILLYNALIYLAIWRPAYLYYVLYVLSFILWQLTYNGLTNRLWGNRPLMVNYAIPVLICLTGITALQFSRTFLDTGRTSPLADRIMRLLQACFGLGVLITLQPNYTVSILYAAVVAFLFAPTVLLAGIMTWKKGFRSARFFTIAWFALLLGTGLLSLKSLGLLPSNFVTEYGQQMGSFIEISLLSLALADQLNMLRQDRERARNEALAAQHLANQRLEEQVADRTRKLQQSNEQLSVLSSKLAKYLSPQVYTSIFQGKTDVDRRSSRKPLTIFFSDIRGFTELTDSMEPEELTEILNVYLSDMAEIALEFGGTIDKFLGDAVMIFFGDPESGGVKQDAVTCVKMALAMRDHIEQVGKDSNGRYGNRPFMVRMGISTGYCTVGNFGAENRLDYTIIGGPVNLASRLQAAAAPQEILISHETWVQVRDHIECGEVGEIQVKGMAYPVKTCSVIGSKDTRDAGLPVLCAEGPGYQIRIDPASLSEPDREQIRLLLESVLSRDDHDAGGIDPTGPA